MGIFNRKQFVVKKYFQVKYVGTILLLVLATVFLSAGITYYVIYPQLSSKLANVYPQSMLISVLSEANSRLFLALVAIVPLATWMGMLLSHRIAGPWYRLESVLLDMAEGNIASDIVKLRKDDELKSLAEALNKVIVRLQTDRVESGVQLDTLKYSITQLSEELTKPGPDNARIKELAAKLLDSSSKLKTLIG